ncbi:MAG: alpha-amylase family glycosyl hydrolase, partial [Anaerolineales bacterium]
PHSLAGQLEYIRTKWGYLLGDILKRIMTSLDFIKEEEKAVFQGSGIAPVLDFTGQELEIERFSPDQDWMPRVVMIAKNTYVWLDQLSKKYQQPIYHLDQIPEAELEQLAKWGFTALWLIGLWERSPASQRIKQLRGNPDAVASAYSLFDYTIANDLGGEDAYRIFTEKAQKYGIRLASDMVPNHMGIDSPWVINHPQWFISVDESPFPSYTFNGPNLSWNDRVGIYIEDHYYNNTDAAVVFKRVDNWSGDVRYIYHGNDGTSMPWNDTAQLNYLLPEVREAVIQTILHVAKRFPIIRFDAAMTLTKRHYQRLWFPEPGSGGDIPSRSEHALTREQFNAAFPNEFWREVVDRVAQEVPDTLLLAEAFWLMEGYFVRTLGMHRVYNSAFMNMLRDEKNLEYRLVLKNTLEFDPQILKRYVNFMNNPDERTAVDQFGKGDKYFGICTMLATLPGLPMFGHGQIEGFTEKYGMEYRRAYWDEQADQDLVKRHEFQIFPLLKKRYLFADVENFWLYDFYTPLGNVNEDVFAYSNQARGEHVLVIYHNRYSTAEGWLRTSSAVLQKDIISGEKHLVQKTLAEALEIANNPNMFTIFRDHISGLQYIIPNTQLLEKGLYLHLHAYQCCVFLDFQQVTDTTDGIYRRLAEKLGYNGTPDLEQAKLDLLLQPIHFALREIFNQGQFNWLMQHRTCPEKQTPPELIHDCLKELEDKLKVLEFQISTFINQTNSRSKISKKIIPALDLVLKETPALFDRELSESLCQGDTYTWSILLSWIILSKIGSVATDEHEEVFIVSARWLQEWQFDKVLTPFFHSITNSWESAQRMTLLLKLLIRHTPKPEEFKDTQQIGQTIQKWIQDDEFRQWIKVNLYQDVTWFNKEAFEEWLRWQKAILTLELTAQSSTAGAENQLSYIEEGMKYIQEKVNHSAYRLDQLI